MYDGLVKVTLNGSQVDVSYGWDFDKAHLWPGAILKNEMMDT